MGDEKREIAFFPKESSEFKGEDVTGQLMFDNIFREDAFDEITLKSDIICYNPDNNPKILIIRRDNTGNFVTITTSINILGDHEHTLHMIKSSLTTNIYQNEDLPEDGWADENTPIFNSFHKVESLIQSGYQVYAVEKNTHHLIFDSLKDLNRVKYYQINMLFNNIATDSDFFKSADFSKGELAEIFLQFYDNIESYNLLEKEQFKNDVKYRISVLLSAVRNSFPYLFQVAQRDQIDHFLSEGFKIIKPTIGYFTEYQVLKKKDGKYQLSTISLSDNTVSDAREYNSFDELRDLGFGRFDTEYVLNEKIFKLESFQLSN